MDSVVAPSISLYQKSGTRSFLDRNRPSEIQLKGDSLYFTCKKKDIIFDFVIKCENLRVEAYKNRYFHTTNYRTESRYYLYFSDTTDESIWIEMSDTFFRQGEFLQKLSQIPNINLGDREWSFIVKYEREWKYYNSPMGRFMRVFIPIVYVSAIILVAYMCSGSNPHSEGFDYIQP